MHYGTWINVNREREIYVVTFGPCNVGAIDI